MQSTPLLLSAPGPLWRGVVAPDKVRSMGQIELNYVAWNWSVFTYKLHIYAKLNYLK